MSNDSFSPKSTWVIGRGYDCDLVVTDAAVSGHHCRLTQQGDGFLLEDLGSRNGTFVNGIRIGPGEHVRLAHGARVTLGLQMPMPWPVVPAGGQDSGRIPRPSARPGSDREIKIGRSPESDVQIDLPIVSWNHAVITEEHGKYFIEDRNSSNGTAIGELSNRIQRSVLDPADEVFLGSYKISAAPAAFA